MGLERHKISSVFILGLFFFFASGIVNAQELEFLSLEEQLWLEENNVFKVAIDPQAAPVEYINDKEEFMGVSRDLLDVISEKLDIHFEWSGNKNWQDGLRQIQNDEADLIAFIARTDDREKYISFTDSYLNLTNVIFTREKTTAYRTIESLYGKKIARVKGYALNEKMRKEHPSIEIIETGSISEALKLLSIGAVDAYIGNIPITAHYITETGLSQIIAVGETSYRSATSMGVRKNNPVLASILNKTLNTIPDRQKQEIIGRWYSLKVENNSAYELIGKIFGPIVFVLFVLILWAYLLSKEVKRRKITEAKLRISEKRAQKAQAIAEKESREKSNFLANMSHEIRTPLNAIIGFSEVMSSGIFGEIKEERYKSYLKDITKSGQHLETVINDILDLSKIEAGKWQLDETQFSLENCMEECLMLIKPHAHKKGINFMMQEQYDKGEYDFIINGDEHAFKRVFINLLSNAVKFTPEDGIVECKVGHENNDRFEIIISDNGIGIPKNKIRSVLRPFGQVHEVREMNESGTGLGLAIVKELVELHDGKLVLESEEGIGTSAIVSLPKERLIA